MATPLCYPPNKTAPRTLHSALIWQWNCRSYNNKKAQLLPYVQQHCPDVIALQETNSSQVTLRNYTAYTASNDSRTAILVSTLLTAQLINLDTNIDYTFIEMLPTRKTQPSVFILNIYSPPSHQLTGLHGLLKQVLNIAKSCPLILLGDFNAPHLSWGYGRNTKKGTRLHDAIQQFGLTLCNHPQTPTRVGNSVSRDTTPDLTMTKNIRDFQWDCLPTTLGSDHHILALTIPKQKLARIRIGTARLTDWKKLREQPADSPITDITEWSEALLQRLKQHTKEIQLTQDYPAVDPHLQHLWDARNSLLKRWKTRRTNRALRKRIAQLTTEAIKYASHLSRQNWTQFCDKLQGTLGTRKTWHLLRTLMGTQASKTANAHQLRRLIHSYPGTEEGLLDDLQIKFARHPTDVAKPLPTYTGLPNSNLDAPFTLAELEAVLYKLTRNTTPGPDQIPNKLLRNLDHITLDHLLDYINNQWVAGTIPRNGATPTSL